MLYQTIKRKIRKALTKIYDPLLNIDIGNQTIKIKLSHDLREIVKRYPEYNFNVARLVKYAEEHLGKVSVIDIGANVGDTVAYIRNYSEAPILCIDGEDNYIKTLRENIAQYKNVSVCHSLVGTENKEEKFKLKVGKGTAHIEESNVSVRVRTLENILEEFPDFKQSKILKSDTDGFDTWILRSCNNYLKAIKPILFFELDPHFIRKNNDDPFSFIEYLREVGYRYLIFYTNVGDFLLSCSMKDIDIIDQLIHYFSGRNIESFVDVCAFTEDDKVVFEIMVSSEIAYFKKVRGY